MDNKMIAKQFFIVNNKMKRLLDKYHQINGLYLGQARLLSFLYRNKDIKIYQKDIEENFQLRGGTVTGLIDSLVKLDYLKREESTTDKRKRKIVLTNLGLVKGEESIMTIRKFEDNIYNLFTSHEIEVLDNIFEKINNYIDTEEQK